jgi:hypothetical protein
MSNVYVTANYAVKSVHFGVTDDDESEKFVVTLQRFPEENYSDTTEVFLYPWTRESENNCELDDIVSNVFPVDMNLQVFISNAIPYIDATLSDYDNNFNNSVFVETDLSSTELKTLE